MWHTGMRRSCQKDLHPRWYFRSHFSHSLFWRSEEVETLPLQSLHHINQMFIFKQVKKKKTHTHVHFFLQLICAWNLENKKEAKKCIKWVHVLRKDLTFIVQPINSNTLNSTKPVVWTQWMQGNYSGRTLLCGNPKGKQCSRLIADFFFF
jgi:hypothetical protein